MCAGLEHKTAGFGNKHEVANNIGIGNGNGTAVPDLALENGNYRAVAAQNIAETGSDKLCGILVTVERLAVNFAQTFRTSHHVGGVYSLVGGYHDEALDAVFHAEVGYNLGALHVIVDGLAGVVFHHRHMLVGCGVENIVGMAGAEDVFHALFLHNAHHDNAALDVRKALTHHQTNVVLRRLGGVDENHFARFKHGYLAHHLGAYAAGRTRYQHGAAA